MGLAHVEYEEIIAAIESGDRPRALSLLERNMSLTYESLVDEGAFSIAK